MRTRLGRSLGAVGFVVWTGACEIRVGGPPPGPPAPRPPPPAWVEASRPAPPSLPARPAPAPPPPAPPRAVRPVRVVSLHLGRIVHPPPLVNVATGQLDVHALALHLRPSRKCGPWEVPPGSGHWIHLDCNLHLALGSAQPFTPRKIALMLRGGLKLDQPVGQAAAASPSSTLAQQVAAAVLPGEVDHRVEGIEGPIADQGQVGACTAFSLASAMDNGIRRQNRPDTMSPLHIWSHYGFPVMQNAGDGNANKPIAPWDAWPYDERVACEIDTSGDGECGPYLPPIIPGAAKADLLVQARIRDADSKGRWRVTEYDEIQSSPDTIAAILVTGADVWLSMDVGNTWFTPQGDTILDWNDQEIDGGHAVLFAGYRHRGGQRQFLVHNSWGKDWGEQGFAYVSDAMVRKYVKHAYKVVVADASQRPVPAGDPNALTDDDCGESQLVDSVTGQCANMCPDDSRPANGQCPGQ